MDEHISANSLVHPKEKQFIVADELLKNVLRTKGEDPVEFVRRDQIMPKILETMQPWYAIGSDKPR